MASAEDDRWANLTGGYRTKYDPRPALQKLELGSDAKAAWEELWEELHHQGDVGEASYAAVPRLVEIYRKHPTLDWNTYALVSIIELARTEPGNPAVPDWLSTHYFNAIGQLAKLGAAEFFRTDDPDAQRSVLSVMALARGLRTHAHFLINYSGDELREIANSI